MTGPGENQWRVVRVIPGDTTPPVVAVKINDEIAAELDPDEAAQLAMEIIQAVITATREENP